MPLLVPPMLAKLARELPEGDFLYEPKWDGFRALAAGDGEEVDLRSRHGRPLARYFPELVGALRTLRAERFVLDGEIVAEPFAALMARLHPAASRVERLARETPASFWAFDLLALGDEALLERPFAERRARLEALVRPPVRLTPATDDPAVARAWLAEHEGVIAKDRGGAYAPGRRAWVKVKREHTADCVVAGFRWSADRPTLGSLLLGLYDGDALVHVGVVTSFTAARRAELLEELRPLAVPLEGHPWEHGFGLERSPVGRLLGAAGRWAPDVITTPERVLWPEAGFTKADAAAYYEAVAPALLPHLADRPLTLFRFPEGVDGPRWFQTQCRGPFRTRRVPGRTGTPQDYCLVDSVEDLLWLVNMGALELHPLLSRGEDVERATHLVFDLDPGPPADVLDCVPVALALRERFPQALVKTSGSVGLHVFVPLGEPLPFEETKALARETARSLPDVTTTARRAERAGKVFVDWSQNERTKSLVAPYSLRALPWPTVSTPVAREELAGARRAADLVFLPEEIVSRLPGPWAR